jgi:hypothetical protein
VAFTVVPRVLDGVEPVCRSCKKLDRKDCRAAVLLPESVDVPDAAPAAAVVDPVAVDPVDAVDAVDVADGDVPVLEVPEVVPPRSAINFENAAFNAEIVLDETVEGAPSAVEVSVSNSLLLKSLTSDVSAATMPLC